MHKFKEFSLGILYIVISVSFIVLSYISYSFLEFQKKQSKEILSQQEIALNSVKVAVDDFTKTFKSIDGKIKTLEEAGDLYSDFLYAVFIFAVDDTNFLTDEETDSLIKESISKLENKSDKLSSVLNHLDKMKIESRKLRNLNTQNK